jgi:hypothetical protein
MTHSVIRSMARWYARRGWIMRVVTWIGLIAAGAVLLPILTMLGLWIAGFPIWQFERDDCTFNSVSNALYRNLLDQAKRQSWTIWPGLSDGVFWPSDRGLRQPTLQFEKALGNRLREVVGELAGDHPSADIELAAAHALMRSLGAHLVSAFEILGFPERDRHIVQFQYFLPQRRFAPLCLHCLIWRYTTIAINFQHDLIADTRQLDAIGLLHGGLKYDPDPIKDRNVDKECPAFPQRSP